VIKDEIVGQIFLKKLEETDHLGDLAVDRSFSGRSWVRWCARNSLVAGLCPFMDMIYDTIYDMM
jgi:hypothetical protein